MRNSRNGAFWVMEHGNSVDFSVYGTTPINDAAWHFLTYVRHSNTGFRELWVDGVLQTNESHSTDNIDTTARMVISGRYTNPASAWTQGVIDEVRLSGIARNSDWISTSYNNQSNPEAYTSFGVEEKAPN